MTTTVQPEMIDPSFAARVQAMDDLDFESMLARLNDNEDDCADMHSRLSTAETNISDLQSTVTMQVGIAQALDMRIGAVETTRATKAYVDSRFTTLIGTAPANLDTLKEISDQLAADETAAAGIVTTMATKAAASDLTALATRVTTNEASIASINTSAGSLATRVTNAESAASTLSGRVSTNEGDITSLKSRATALESGAGSFSAWKAAPASSPDVPATVTLPTQLIAGLVSTVTKAGIEAAFGTVMTEINSMKASLRSRTVFA